MYYKSRWQAAETSVSQLTRSKVVDRTFGFDVKHEHEGRGAMALAKLANHLQEPWILAFRRHFSLVEDSKKVKK